uniref:Uncharacterized protein n=1 Tax=Fagus sylvatica TaxID=28930 RepID=A0A2N9I1U2_FAGSY
MEDKDLDDATLWAFHKYPKTPNSTVTDSRVSTHGEVLHEPWVYRPPRSIARTSPSEASETSPLVVLRNVQRTPTAPVYSSPEVYLSPEIGKFSVKELSACSEGSFGRSEEEHIRHSLSGRFPSVSLFKEYQNAAMASSASNDIGRKFHQNLPMSRFCYLFRPFWCLGARLGFKGENLIKGALPQGFKGALVAPCLARAPGSSLTILSYRHYLPFPCMFR